MSPVRRVKAKIGELLLQRGLITPEQLQEALFVQHNQNKDKQLGQILIELGYVDKEELYGLLAIQNGFPYINLNHYTIEPNILSLLPQAIAKKYQVLPLDKIQDVLTVAMVNPLDKVIIDQIEKLTKSNVKVFLTTRLELEEAFFHYYGKK